MLDLLVHVGLDHVHRHVARAFDHGLHIVLPGDLREFAQRAQLGELGLVVRIGTAAGAQAVAEREAHVVGLHDVADVLEVRVEEALLVVRDAPLGHDRAAARHDARHAVGREVNERQAQARVDGEVVDALLRLLDERVAVDFPGEVFGHAAHLFERLVDRHRADGHRRVAHDPVARGVDVLAGRQVHDVVGAPANGPHQLFDFFLDARSDRRVADVGVDLHLEVAPDGHRLDLGVVDVGGDDGAAAGHFVAHELGRDDARNARAHRVARHAFRALLVGEVFGHPLALAVLAQGHVFHFGRDDAAACVVHLGDVGARLGAARRALQRRGTGAQLGQALRVAVFVLGAVVQRVVRAAFITFGVAALDDPGAAHVGQAAAHVDLDLRVGVGARGVVQGDGFAVGQRHVAHGHEQVGPAARNDALVRGGKGFARQRQQRGELVGGIHRRHSLLRERVLRNRSMDLGRPATEKGSDGPKSGSAALLTPV
ncbi:hypothetical protein D9M68_599660 [compost metagenome]